MSTRSLNVLEKVYEKLKCLETLIIEDSRFNFQTLRLSSLPFLTTTLKRLYLPANLFKGSSTCPSATNAVWILTFCRGLKSCFIGFTISVKDFFFLREYSDALKGLSKVEDLAFQFTLVYDPNDESNNEMQKEDESNECVGGDKKSDTLYRLLSITNRLRSLEISEVPPAERDFLGEINYQRTPCTGCFQALVDSYETLESLRYFRLEHDSKNPTSTDFTPFKRLKHFSTDFKFGIFSSQAHSFLKLPSNLENFWVVYLQNYRTNLLEMEEETKAWFQMLEMRSWPSLKEIFICFQPGSVLDHRSLWSSTRLRLGKFELFKIGNVKLRKWIPGQAFHGTVFETLKKRSKSSFPSFLS